MHRFDIKLRIAKPATLEKNPQDRKSFLTYSKIERKMMIDLVDDYKLRMTKPATSEKNRKRGKNLLTDSKPERIYFLDD